MRATVTKSTLKRLLANIGVVLNDDVIIEYTRDGWRIRGTDHAHVALVEINVWRSAMESYDFVPDEGEGGQRSVVDYARLAEAVNILPDDVPIGITDDGSMFSLDAGKYHAKVRLLSQGMLTDVEIPEISSNFVFGMNTLDLERMLVAAKNVRDEVVFSCDGDGLVVSVISESLEGMEYSDPEIVSEEPISARFPLDYVVDALRGIRGNVLIELASDYPIKIVANDPFTTMYLLAPRIVKDDVPLEDGE